MRFNCNGRSFLTLQTQRAVHRESGLSIQWDAAPAKGTEPRSRSSAGSHNGGQPISTGGRGLTNKEKRGLRAHHNLS